MPFRFKKSESPAKAVRRVYRERVDAALDCLRKPEHPAAVHGARKEIKKLRALLRLVRGEISVGTYRKGVKALRAAADCLAATRDARVMLKAFEKLAGRSASKRFEKIGRALDKHARRETRKFKKDDAVALAERLLKKTNRRVGSLKIKLTGWDAIEPGLRQSYQRGRDCLRLARKSGVPETFHEWRREVKDLWFYFCLLRPICPAATRSEAGELERLSLLLGEDHDLFMLQHFIQGHCDAGMKEAQALDRMIDARQKELRAGALKSGTRLYGEAPAAFCRRVGQWRR